MNNCLCYSGDVSPQTASEFDYAQMVCKFGQVYIDELTTNYQIVHPTGVISGYIVGCEGDPYLMVHLPDGHKVLWNPRVDSAQAMELQTALRMEIRTAMSENTVSVYLPALDKPLDYDESWSMGHAVWDNITCSYKAALCKIISEVAAVCINRSWNMKDSSYVYQSLFGTLAAF